MARELDDTHVVIRADFEYWLVEQFPDTFSVPARFRKHMMVAADLAGGDAGAIGDAIESAWQPIGASTPRTEYQGSRVSHELDVGRQLVPGARGHDCGRDAAGVQGDGASYLPGERGALVRRAAAAAWNHKCW